MSRAQRLLDLLQLLRSHRYPVSGAQLAGQLGISLRTLYRDIAVLQAQGAHIEGEAGLGYVLRPGFLLPPLMFSEEEIQALVLGSRWVAEHADSQLGQAARNALAKIAAVLPSELRHEFDDGALFVVPGEQVPDTADVALIRDSIRRERKLRIEYRDEHAAETARVIWPFALGFFDRVRIVAAWCELRQGFRHFRTDRIVALAAPGDRYPQRRQSLLKTWRELMSAARPE
ncbi:DNA-binding protein [Bordetella sp. H567]|uniref:helix-turn-helix transcriptional regulator n=1 Tax=Bordetella sp. H567 TaxID=1697043 RepID=UPI00081C5F6E|nr:YafY family protein [Bordetella sp. H567]AOB32676.1 DNA-binding protein [Bordetella sp. H567]